jgi:glycosyltransferase involved in cell wall biosynthesis
VGGKTLFLVNGGPTSAAATRALRIAEEIGDRGSVVRYRTGSRLTDVTRLLKDTISSDYDVIYAMELAVVPVLAAALGLGRHQIVIDTGDAPAAFLRLVSAGRPKVFAAECLELVGYRIANHIIVRGPYHQQILDTRGFRNVAVVPDGVDLDVFKPVDSSALRRQLGLDGAFTIGIQGHFTWYPALGGGLGSELVKAISLRRDLPLHAVLIGDGAGLPHLRTLASELGVSDRLHIIGQVPYEELPRYLSLCDVCLLTQTNDESSWVRTTGKLPGYLATGRYILASRVGTAATLLPEEMLIDYDGSWDERYPTRLASRIAELVDDTKREAKGLELRGLAEQFDYGTVASMAADIVRSVSRSGR